MTILGFANGDLKLIINELEIENLTADDSGQQVLKHILASYAEYMEKKLPQVIENGIYDKDVSRRRNEGMLPYCIRRDKLFKQLEKEGWTIPAEAKGYILLRDSHLPEKARDLIEMWSGGDYTYPGMQKYLKKLERPVPGSGGQRITGLIGFVDEAPSASASLRNGPDQFLCQQCGDASTTYFEESSTFMIESLFVLPESFDDALLDEAAPYLENPEILFVAGDMADDVVLEEDEAVAILANYGQVRQYLHKKTLNRGFFKNKPPGGSKPFQPRRPPMKALTDGGSNFKNLAGKFTARPKMWTKSSLVGRTKCARCGQVGHWARTCTNPPDERGKRRTGMSSTGFMIAEDENASIPAAFIFMFSFAFPETMETLIGLFVTAGFGLLDTGAQHGVIGLDDYKRWCERLAQQGLKPRILPTWTATAVGVGGGTSFLITAELPVGVQGVSGCLVVNVIQNKLPLLIPMSFCKKLGMILDTVDNTATWKYLGNKVSEVVNLESDHIAIDLLEFPPGGWTNPHETPNALTDREPDKTITRADFETAIPTKPVASYDETFAATTVLKPAGDTLPEPSSSSASALLAERPDVQQGMSHHGQDPQPLERERISTYRDEYKVGRLGQVHRVTVERSLEESRVEGLSHVLDDCSPDQSEAASGNGCLRTGVQDRHDSQGEELDRTSPVLQRSSSRSAPGLRSGTEGPTEGAHGPDDVPAQRSGHDAPRQQDGQMVDLPEVLVTLGQDPGCVARKPCDPGRRGYGDFRQACGLNVPPCVSGGHAVLRVGPEDTRGGAHPCNGISPAAVGPIHPHAEHPRNSRSGRLARYGAVGSVNRLVHGTALAAMAFSVTIGYMAQVVSAGIAYTDLEGPVFGTRVGIYHLSSLSDRIQVSAHVDNATLTPKDFGYRVVLYKLPHGSVEHSTEDDCPNASTIGMVATVPHRVKAMLAKASDIPKVHTYPVDSEMAPIPEDSIPSALAMPAERNQSDEWSPAD